MASHPVNAKYPDTVALTYDETNHKVACVYSDRSLYLWDITDIRKVYIRRSSRMSYEWWKMSIILKEMKTKKSNFSWKFVRLGSRTRSFTMLPAFGAWSLIHLPKKAWRAFYLPALSWPAPATTRSEFGTWILIWAPTPSTGGTFTATYKSTHLIEEISSERDKSLMSFVFVCLFFLTWRRIYSRPYT